MQTVTYLGKDQNGHPFYMNRDIVASDKFHERLNIWLNAGWKIDFVMSLEDLQERAKASLCHE